MLIKLTRISLVLGTTVALALGLGACGGSPKTKTDVKAPAATDALLGLGELKLIDVDKNKAVLIHADGTIELDGKLTGVKVTADGKLVKADTGEVGFQLDADGTMKGPKGEAIGLKLAADGTATMGDKTISIDDGGNIAGGNPGAPKMKVEGATDAKLKRTAMFVLVALTAGSESHSEVHGEPATEPASGGY